MPGPALEDHQSHQQMIHLNSPSCREGDHFDAHRSHVDDLHAQACGRPNPANLLAVEVLFADTDDHRQETW